MFFQKIWTKALSHVQKNINTYADKRTNLTKRSIQFKKLHSLNVLVFDRRPKVHTFGQNGSPRRSHSSVRASESFVPCAWHFVESFAMSIVRHGWSRSSEYVVASNRIRVVFVLCEKSRFALLDGDPWTSCAILGRPVESFASMDLWDSCLVAPKYWNWNVGLGGPLPKLSSASIKAFIPA